MKEAEESGNDKTFASMNEHWRPSNSYCAFCNINFTALSKTESFNEDKTRIMETLGMKVKNKKMRLHPHGGSNITALTKRYMKKIDFDTRNAIIDLYKYDFDMFDYYPDIY